MDDSHHDSKYSARVLPQQDSSIPQRSISGSEKDHQHLSSILQHNSPLTSPDVVTSVASDSEQSFISDRQHDKDHVSIHTANRAADLEKQNDGIEAQTLPKSDLKSEKPGDNTYIVSIFTCVRPPLTFHKVKFTGPGDPANPKCWTSKQKWTVVGIASAFTFLTPLASTMIAPALTQIGNDFDIKSSSEMQINLSIFVLAFAIGPMFLAPLSELYGRVVVLQASNIMFVIFNIACGFAQNKTQLMVFRFLSGFGGSGALPIGGGILGDLFMPEERGKAMGLYSMGPLLGPTIGPVVGGWVAEKSTWRWMFWSSSIVSLVILAIGFWKLVETYPPVLLERKARALRKESGNTQWRAEGTDDVHQPFYLKICRTMSRSFGMFFTEPIVQAMGLYMAFSYGLLYLALATFPGMFMMVYGESVGIAGLNYLSLGLGFMVGTPLCAKLNMKVYLHLKEKSPNKIGKPENRMPVIIPFSFLVPVGLLIYGWTAHFCTHWIGPNIGAFIFAIGTVAAFQAVTTYLVDSYGRFSASAIAAVTILRSLTGFAFPIFAPAMYETLGCGWTNSILALAAVLIGIPVPIFLWIYGERLRKRSKMAMTGKPPEPPPPPAGVMRGAAGPMDDPKPNTLVSGIKGSTVKKPEMAVPKPAKTDGMPVTALPVVVVTSNASSTTSNKR